MDGIEEQNPFYSLKENNKGAVSQDHLLVECLTHRARFLELIPGLSPFWSFITFNSLLVSKILAHNSMV